LSAGLLAHERGIVELDAEVTRIQTRYDIPPDVDIRQVIHTQQRQQFMEHSGLARARPQAAVEFSCPHGYPELLELIKAHGYDLERRTNRLMAREEIAGNWYDTIFVPGVAALREERVPEAYSYKTDADLFLWVYQQRRRLLVEDASTGYHKAARAVREGRMGWWRRRQLRRDRTEPLSIVKR